MITMGHVINAFGILGWIKIHPYTDRIDGLLEYKTWWLGKSDNHWNEMQVITGRVNGNLLVAKLKGCDDRDQALRLKGMQIAIPRSKLPDLPENGQEGYYWFDLIGAEAVNLNNERLGTVIGLFKTGANDVLKIKTGKGNAHELLIPFVEDTFIKKVDLKNFQIVIDWELDY